MLVEKRGGMIRVHTTKEIQSKGVLKKDKSTITVSLINYLSILFKMKTL